MIVNISYEIYKRLPYFIFIVGDIENGIEHLSTALAVCGEPSHLIEVLESQLPPQVFNLLMQRLPIVSQVWQIFYMHLKEKVMI